MSSSPAGWHPDPQQPGQERYWDGAQWTDQRRPIQGAAAAGPSAKSRRGWIGWVVGGLVGLIVGVAAAGGGSETTTTTETVAAAADSAATVTVTRTAEPAAAPEPKGPSSKLPLQDGDWRLDTISVKDDGLGDFGGRARMTYTGKNPSGGTNVFTVTVFVGGKDVASLQGSASSVRPGDAVTVDLISQDKFVGGPYKYDFQNNI